MSIYDTDPPTVALAAAFTSPHHDGHEPANVVDGLFAIAHAVSDLAAAIREGHPPGPIITFDNKLTDEQVLAIRKRFADVERKAGRR